MNGARDPRDSLSDEPVEESPGGGADVVAALGMPLNAEDKMCDGTFGSLSTFDRFDDGVLWAAGGDAQTVARDADSLMVTGVDWKTEEGVLLWGFCRRENGPEKRFRCDGGSVSDGDLAASGVIDRERVEILHQRTSSPYVKDLDAKADGEDRFVEIVRVLKEKFVDVFARIVGGSARGDSFLAVLLGVDVCGATREENCLTGINQSCNLDRRGV